MSKEINKRALISAAILNLSLINGVFAMEDQGAQNPQFAVPDLGKLLSAVSDTNVAQQADLLFDQEVTAKLPVQQKVEPQKPALAPVDPNQPKVRLLRLFISNPQGLIERMNQMETGRRNEVSTSIMLACVRYSNYLKELNKKDSEDKRRILQGVDPHSIDDLLNKQSNIFREYTRKIVKSVNNPEQNSLEASLDPAIQMILGKVMVKDKDVFTNFINQD